MVQPLHIKGAQVWDGQRTIDRDLYTTKVVLDKPANGALTVDLEGSTIFPGLINAHDHLELNHYPRSKFRERYDNAHQWGEDMNARLDTEPYKSLRAYPLRDRLFIGGLKNLLCGATTVAHHNPPHKALWRKDFPVRVLRKYGWAHSLHFNTDEEIIRSYRSTPPGAPWFIHLAEGTDDIAAGEYQRLKALGCVGKNTVIVHGVGIPTEDEREAAFNTHLVLCPTTNKYLLDKALNTCEDLETRVWTDGMALGSDSRLTAQGDLLDEMRFAARYVMDDDMTYVVGICLTSARCVVHMVTGFAASMLRMNEIGHLGIGAVADTVLIRSPSPISPFGEAEVLLCNARRADLAVVVKGGVPQLGDPDVMAKFPHIPTVAASLDGRPKAIHADLARRILACKLKEPGLEVESLPKRTLRMWKST